ncbi:MAG TPA: LysR family transcriptional regulator [Selenomonadales bacterium]|nr:LysR family transcriptional regulator [Selenomonadales bacterium]
MEERDWLILQILYEQKNITKTAQALFMSQPALTARLQHLEKEFGVQIVQRTSKGVNFTPQGEYLAKASAEVLQRFRRIREEVTDLGASVAGTLRLGASSYFTMYTLPGLLRLFRKRYPAVEFKVATTWSKDVFNLVYNQDVHIGFISADYGWQNEKHLLFEEPVYVASTEKIGLADLPRLPRIDYQTDALIRAMIDRWWRENFSQPPAISMEVDKLATCWEMVKSGLGYAIVPGRIVEDAGGIHKILLADRAGNPLVRKAWMIYHEESLALNVIRAFTEFVKQTDFSGKR